MSFAYNYEVQKKDGQVTYKTIIGVLSIEGEELLFEYKLYDQSRTSISVLNKFSFNVDLLQSIRFKKKLFNAYIIIKTVQPVFLEPLPGSSKGTIQLHIDRNHRKHAEDFCIKVNTALEKRRN